MPQDFAPNRVAREPEDMNSGVLDTLRGALLLTPPGRVLEMSQLLQSLRDIADQQLVIESAEMLGTGLVDPMDIHVASVHAHTRFHGTTIFHPLNNIPTSGLAREAALGAVADTERANPGLYNQMMRGDQAATQQFQDAVDAAVANPQARNVTPPVQAEVTSENVRVTGSCRQIRICFMPNANIRNNPALMREYRRQLQLQQNGINSMSPAQLVTNRKNYQSTTGYASSQAIAGTTRSATNAAYRRAHRSFLRRTTPGINSRNLAVRGAAEASVQARLSRRMGNVAALHGPDMVAGGDPAIVMSPTSIAAASAGRPIPEIGNRRVNSSIGRSWGNRSGSNTRGSRLEEHAERQAAMGCPSTQADLDVCESQPRRPGVPRI